MRSWLWAVVPAFLLFQAEAFAGAIQCQDACTSFFGEASCSSFGAGCVIPPGKGVGNCATCTTNAHCSPGGMCVGGNCLNVLCGVDAGGMDAVIVDAVPPLDIGPRDVGDSGSDDGAGVTDAEPLDVATSTPTDGGSFLKADSLPTTVGPTGPAPAPLREKKDECGCTTTPDKAVSPWAWSILGLLLLRRRR